MEEGEIREQLDGGEDETFVYSGAASDDPAPPPSDVPSPSAPITMRATSSSLSRERSSSTSAIKEGKTAGPSSSLTPRGEASPFSRFENDNILTLNSDLSKTPSASTQFHRPAPTDSPLRSSIAPSAKELDLDVLKKLIFSAAASGDLDRLQALMDGGNESDEYPSAFTISNWTNSEGEVRADSVIVSRGNESSPKFMYRFLSTRLPIEDIFPS